MTLIKINIMKNKIIALGSALVLLLVVTSCDSEDGRINFDPNVNNSETIIGFLESNATFVIELNQTGELEVVTTSTTRSEIDRVFNMSINNDLSNVDPVYLSNLPTSFTIPANEIRGSFIIEGIDPLGNTALPQSLVLDMTSPESENSFVPRININVIIGCPTEENSFVGDYTITNIVPVDFGNLYAEGSTVNISLGSGPGERMFTAVVLEDLEIGQPANTLVFNPSCDDLVLVSDNQGSNLQCGGPLVLGTPLSGELGTYNPDDDSEFDIVIGYNTTSEATCAVPSDAVIRLTKL